MHLIWDCFLWQDQPDTGYLIEGIEVGCESRCNLQIIHSLIFLASFANLKPAMHCMSQYTWIHLLTTMILDHSKYFWDWLFQYQYPVSQKVFSLGYFLIEMSLILCDETRLIEIDRLIQSSFTEHKNKMDKCEVKS